MGLRSQNNPSASFRDVFSATGKDAAVAVGPSAPGEQGITATGGVVSEYLQGGKFYRAHVFTSTSTFDVTNIADSEFGSTVECLVVAGGGGGGSHSGGGGGAGGMLLYAASPTGGKTANGGALPVSVSSYNVVIGGVDLEVMQSILLFNMIQGTMDLPLSLTIMVDQ